MYILVDSMVAGVYITCMCSGYFIYLSLEALSVLKMTFTIAQLRIIYGAPRNRGGIYL